MFKLKITGDLGFEIWRPIREYETYYEISNYGRVKALDRITYRKNHGKIVPYPMKEKILKATIGDIGYKNVVLCDNKGQTPVGVHRLVAFAFPEYCGEYFKGAVVNHKDENRSNNVAWNLEWCTQQYNLNYGRSRQKIIDANRRPVKQFSKEGAFIKEWKSIGIAEKELHINNISICCSGKRKTAGGFKWEYC